MIKFALVCDNAHDFDSWFADGAAYETQWKRGQVACPVCDSIKVSKAIMAPALIAGRRNPMPPPAPGMPVPGSAAPNAEPHVPESSALAPDEDSAGPQPMALLDERHRALRAMMQHLHAKIVENTDDVGKRFPAEARRMHEGDIPTRSIRGEASIEDARELLEEGIQILPMPMLPEERN